MTNNNISDDEYFIDSYYAKNVFFDLIDKKDINKLETLLLDNPRLINAKTSTGHVTALMSAAGFSNNTDIINFLIIKGADVHAKDCNGWTALLWGICQKENIEVLLSNGSDVNVKGKNGRTPLIQASYYGCLDIVKILVSYGADLNVKNNEGYTALMIAKAEGNMDIADFLRKHGAKE